MQCFKYGWTAKYRFAGANLRPANRTPPVRGICRGVTQAAYDRGLMVIPIALPALRRKRGNPNWGRPMPPAAPALATEFELQVKQLQLTLDMYPSSLELRTWCQQNRNRIYIPEWLLKEWGITVDLGFNDAA